MKNQQQEKANFPYLKRKVMPRRNTQGKMCASTVTKHKNVYVYGWKGKKLKTKRVSKTLRITEDKKRRGRKLTLRRDGKVMMIINNDNFQRDAMHPFLLSFLMWWEEKMQRWGEGRNDGKRITLHTREKVAMIIMTTMKRDDGERWEKNAFLS